MGQSAVIACSDIDELQPTTPGSDLPATQGSILTVQEEVSPPVVSKSVSKPKKGADGTDFQRRRVQSTKTGSVREAAVTVLNEKNPFRIEENKALYEAFERRTNRTKSWVESNQREKLPKKKPDQNPFDRMRNKILHQAYERRTKRVENIVAVYTGSANETNPFRTIEESSPPVKKTNRGKQGGARRPIVEVNSDQEDDTNPFSVARNPNSPNSRSFSNIRNPNNPRSQNNVRNTIEPSLRSESEDSLEFLRKEPPEEAANNGESSRFDSMLQSSKNEVKDSPVSSEKASRFDNLLQVAPDGNPVSLKSNITEPSSYGDSLFKKRGNDIFGKEIFDTRKKSRDVMDIFGAEEDTTGGEDFFKVDTQEKADDQNGILCTGKSRNLINPTRKSRSVFEDAANGNDGASSRCTNPFDLYDAKESSTKAFLDPDKMFDSENGNVHIDVEKTSTKMSNGEGHSNNSRRSANNNFGASTLFGDKKIKKASKSGGHFTDESNSNFKNSRDMDSESDELLFVKKEAKQTALSHNDGDSEKDVANWLFNDY